MPMTQIKFEPGQKCMIEVHGANYPEGVWEGVVETVQPYESAIPPSAGEAPWFVVTTRFTDPRMLIERERGVLSTAASYYDKPATSNSNVWPIETKRLFDALRQQREDNAVRNTHYATREKALLDALKVAGKEAIVEELGKAVQVAVTAATREVFDPVKQSLGSAIARLDEVLRLAQHVLERRRPSGPAE